MKTRYLVHYGVVGVKSSLVFSGKADWIDGITIESPFWTEVGFLGYWEYKLFYKEYKCTGSEGKE